ncbi:MAG: hypothetical protein A07HR60_02201 [uncultured archaeon A07HR60]|nr:MAG: hypothetical protein A07HR60_02201 [uncultured archaeon A07HR60]
MSAVLFASDSRLAIDILLRVTTPQGAGILRVSYKWGPLTESTPTKHTGQQWLAANGTETVCPQSGEVATLSERPGYPAERDDVRRHPETREILFVERGH